MKKLLVVATSVLVLTACNSKTQSADAGIPADCQEYMKSLQTMMDKTPAMAEQFKKTLDESKAQWAKLDKSQAEATGAGCKQANESLKALMPK